MDGKRPVIGRTKKLTGLYGSVKAYKNNPVYWRAGRQTAIAEGLAQKLSKPSGNTKDNVLSLIYLCEQERNTGRIEERLKSLDEVQPAQTSFYS